MKAKDILKMFETSTNPEEEKRSYIIDDETKEILFSGSDKQCQYKLAYFLNNGHDAYIVDSPEGYKKTEFTVEVDKEGKEI